LNIIFAGTPEFSAIALQTLLDSEHNVIAVYTQPDRPAGRGRKLHASPVKQLAVKHDIAVYQPQRLTQQATQDELIALSADVMIVVAYGLLLPKVILDAPKYGCLNIHASLLPRWRGAAPIQRAILAGDAETGVTIMQMDEGLDTGDMLTIKSCAIEAQDTGSTLHDKLASMGAQAMMQTLNEISADRLKPQPQDNSLANYAHKLDKKEAQIDWQDSAVNIVRKIQAFNSWPVAYTPYKGQSLRLWQACLIDATKSTDDKQQEFGKVLKQTSSGIDVSAKEAIVRITELQMPGKKRIMVKDFINGQSLAGVSFNNE